MARAELGLPPSLTLHQLQSDRPGHVLAGAGAPDPSPIHVLIVEDDGDHADIVKATLERQDLRVTVVGDGAGCFGAVASQSYSLILLDYSLPRMNGLEVLAELRARGVWSPVVMVSAQGDEELAIESMKAGVMDFVVKTSGYLAALPTVLRKVLTQHERAVEHDRLHRETERRLREAEALVELSRTLTSKLDLQALLGVIGRAAARACDMDRCSIFDCHDGRARLLVSQFASGALDIESFADWRESEGRPVTMLPFLETALRLREAVLIDDPGHDPLVPAGLVPFQPNVLLVLPLQHQDAATGALVLDQSDSGKPVTTSRLVLATTVASHVGLALEHGRLYAESQRALADLKEAQDRLVRGEERRRKTAEALADVDRFISHSLNPAEVAERITESVRTLLGVSNSALFEVRLDTQELVSLCLKGDHGPGARPIVYPIGYGAVGVAAKERHPILTSDLLDDPRIAQLPEKRARMEQAPFRAVMALPLLLQDRLVGVLMLGDRAGRVFSEEEVSIAQAFADQATVAMHNARLYQESESRRQRLATLVEVSQRLTRGLDLPTVLGSIADSAAQLLQGEVGFRLLEGEELVRMGITPGAQSVMAKERTPLGESISGWVATTGQAAVTTDRSEDSRLTAEQRRAARQNPRLAALMCVPIRLGTRILGTLNVYRERGHRFSDEALRMATSFADQAAIAIENARLFALSERQRRAAEALAEVGQTLTQSLDTEVVARRILEIMGNLLRTGCPSLYRRDPASGDLVSVAVGPEFLPALGEHVVLPCGIGVTGRAVEERQAVATPNVLEDPRIILTPAARAVIERTPHRAILSAPLIVNGNVIGAISVRDRLGRVYDAEEIRIAQAFADQAALALQNAEILQDSRLRQRRLETLLQVNRQLSLVQPVDVLLQAVAASAVTLFGDCAVSLWVIDRDRDVVRLAADAGLRYPERRGRSVLGLGEGIIGRAITEQRPVVFDDLQEEPLSANRALSEAEGFHAALVVPLVFAGRCAGALSVRRRSHAGFRPDEVELLASLASQAGSAIENAQLYEQAQMRAARMKRLNQLGQMVGSSLDAQHVLDFVASAAGELLHGEVAHLWVIDEATGALRLAASTDGTRPAATPKIDTLDRGQGVAGSVVERKAKYYAANLAEDPHFANKAWARACGYVSMIAVPLVAGEAAVGVLAIITRSPRTFTTEEEELLELFAGKAAVALVNARLYEATQRALGELKAKNAELDSFVYSASHDLKAPLVTIQGMASMLLADCASSLDERGQHYLQRIHANIRQMEGLISDLLALSRVGRESRPAELVSLADVVDEVLASLAEPVRASGVKVVRHELGSVWGLRTQLEQVFANLIGNAVKYLGDSPDPQVEIGAVERDGWVECYVRDNGIGIDAAYHAQVFELFQRLKEVSAEGSGVGLAIVKKIVEAAGGRVWVESAKGHGATFFFTWPQTKRSR